MTGNKFLRDCKVIIEDREATADERWRTAFCAGYVQGFMDEHDAWQILEETQSKQLVLFCIPDVATNQQIIKIIAKYMGDHPDKLHIPASLLMEKALNIAFPCK